MSPAIRRRAVTRGLFALSLVAVAAASIAARPIAPGITYRVRMSIPAPDIPGMPAMPSTLIVGRGTSLGTLSRMEIDTVEGQVPIAIGDFMLMLDSGRTVMVSPSTKSYSEGVPGLAAIPPEILAQAMVSNVNVVTEKLGAGETIQGYATEKARITITYSLAIMGQSLNTMTTVEMWLAQLPASIVTPFDGAIPKEMAQGPMKELAEKANAARASLGKGTSLKTVTTASITGPMNLTTVNTLELLDLKPADVDPAIFKVPEGYSKRP